MADAKWTYTLTLILTDWLETWRQELLLMDEQQVLYELGQAGINNYPVRRERHLFFELPGPLTLEQQAWLERSKQAGLFLDYQVSKDLTPEHVREWIQARRKEVMNPD